MIQSHRLVTLQNGYRLNMHRVRRPVAERIIRLGGLVGVTSGQAEDPQLLTRVLPSKSQRCWYWAVTNPTNDY